MYSSLSMLFSIVPISLVFLSIGSSYTSISMLLVFIVISLVYFPIWPLKHSFSIHFITFSHSGVLTTIAPCIFSKAFYKIVIKLTFIPASI
mmetsp:Transcript_4149/g.549  ORF Transcript_4149/g.549 Transcript_4149/m.549 type:complete len:91 (-) Transcript_4149:691-963(-)